MASVSLCSIRTTSNSSNSTLDAEQACAGPQSKGAGELPLPGLTGGCLLGTGGSVDRDCEWLKTKLTCGWIAMLCCMEERKCMGKRRRSLSLRPKIQDDSGEYARSGFGAMPVLLMSMDPGSWLQQASRE